MIERHLSRAAVQRAKRHPVVAVTGPRQSGKTTLCRSTFPDNEYCSLEDPDQRGYAEEDPRGFLGQFKDAVILDEAQRVPELFSFLQAAVDQDPAPGRFILSGSQNFLLMRSISQSLAGRVSLLQLYPFTLSELESRDPLDIQRLDEPDERPRRTNRDLLNVLHTGSYPRIHDRGLPAQEWLLDYIRTYLERDLRELSAVADLSLFTAFLRLLAAQSARTMNLSTISRELGVSQPTARRWLSLLETSYIAFRLPPHHRNFRKQIIRRPKIYLTDSGLLCALLGIRDAEDLHRHPSRGAIFETWVVTELLKNWAHKADPLPFPLFYWRDRQGHELDLLIDLGQRMIAGEIKAGFTMQERWMNGLKWWWKQAEEPNAGRLLIHAGDTEGTRSGVFLRSWRSL